MTTITPPRTMSEHEQHEPAIEPVRDEAGRDRQHDVRDQPDRAEQRRPPPRSFVSR